MGAGRPERQSAHAAHAAHARRAVDCAVDRAVRLAAVSTDLQLDLPPSIALPDGEEFPYGASARLHIRDPEQVGFVAVVVLSRRASTYTRVHSAHTVFFSFGCRRAKFIKSASGRRRTGRCLMARVRRRTGPGTGTDPAIATVRPSSRGAPATRWATRWCTPSPRPQHHRRCTPPHSRPCPRWGRWLQGTSPL